MTKEDKRGQGMPDNLGTAEAPKHPLEGKYIVYEYREADYDSEGSALEVLQLRDGRLVTVFSPGAHYDPGQLGREVDGEAIRTMHALGVTEVYSIHTVNDFFGIPPQWEPLSDKLDENGDIASWSEHETICSDTDLYDLLTENGITVVAYDADENKILGS